MSQALKFAQVGGAQQLYVDDVFSSYVRSGTGASATITNNIDLSTYGGLVWTKARSAATGHRFTDTARGVTKSLDSSSSAAEATEAQGLTAFGTTGYTIGTDTDYNNSTGPVTYVDWTFRKAPKFFDVVTFTAPTAMAYTFNHSLGVPPGMVILKPTSSTGEWFVYHRSAGSTQYAFLNLSNAFASTGNWITPTSTQITVSDSTLIDGVSYVAYLFAHDASTDGIIQCGSFTTDGSGNATVNLGWEPQFVLMKASSTTSNWYLHDNMRGFPVSPAISGAALYPNLSNAENTSIWAYPTATGFTASGVGTSTTLVYLAIRRPNKPPTSGTQVYAAGARTGTGSTATSTSAGFPPDLVFTKKRSSTNLTGARFVDRLRGATNWLDSSATTAETSTADTVTLLDKMTGCSFGADATTGAFNTNTHTYVDEFLRRAPGVFDVVCYTGTGSNKTETHSLGVAPEFWIVKGRSGATAWAAGCTSLANTEYLVPNTTAAKATGATYWNSTFPTESVFTVGTAGDVNTSSSTYVAYLFATKAGISKVGSYTGNGSNQTINCGFSAGARFVLIKRTDSTGDWYVWDSARGIVAGNDSHLSLNTTAAEVTTDDSIDPDTSGFIVNQDAATNINVNTATYIYLAFA